MIFRGFRCVGFLALLLGTLNAVTAFTTSPFSATTNSRINRRFIKEECFDSALGPVARNGIDYDDVKLGDGRRILPGDTVYCYYIGSFAGQAKKDDKGFLGAIIGGSDSDSSQQTVFDQVSKCQSFNQP